MLAEGKRNQRLNLACRAGYLKSAGIECDHEARGTEDQKPFTTRRTPFASTDVEVEQEPNAVQ